MKPEEAIKILEVAQAECEWNAPLEYQEAFEMAISALEKQDVPDTNVGDLISRRAAIEAMMKLQAEDDEAYGCHIPEGFDGERAKEALEGLPSAQPEIVRCKDCKLFGDPKCLMCLDGYDWAEPDGYCHMAERWEK